MKMINSELVQRIFKCSEIQNISRTTNKEWSILTYVNSFLHHHIQELSGVINFKNGPSFGPPCRLQRLARWAESGSPPKMPGCQIPVSLNSFDMFFPAVHFFIIYSQIGVTMTLLIVSDIHNHSTNCGLVPPDFATVLYHIA